MRICRKYFGLQNLVRVVSGAFGVMASQGNPTTSGPKKVSQGFFVLGDCPMAVLVFFLGTAGAGSVAPYFPPIC